MSLKLVRDIVTILTLWVLAVEAVDLTLESGAVGTDVVLATISKLEASQIFSSDKRLLRRIAYVESEDGREPPVYGSGGEQGEVMPLATAGSSTQTRRQTAVSYGGIWNVDGFMFLRTTIDETVAVKRAEIAAAFPEVGDWEDVTWDDLNKPLWSALAARLVLLLAENVTDIPNASDVPGQAVFWKDSYNADGDIGEFERKVQALTDEERCRVKSDMIFMMDSSRSVRRSNFRRVKQFVYDFVESVDIAPNRTQVGVILFSDIAWTVFSLSTFAEKEPLLDEIDEIPYIKGYTNTADALCVLLEEGFTEESGARLLDDDVFRIAIVITDGKSNKNSSRCSNATILEVAQSVHNFSHSILVFSIGVTDEVNEDELQAIATKEEYITYLEDFSESALAAVRDDQFYELCTKSTIPRGIGSDVNGSLEEGGLVRYEFEIPLNGLSLNICVSQGEIELYSSFSVPNPNSALNDFMLLVKSNGSCMNVSIERHESTTSDQPAQDSVFVSIEGTEQKNVFNIMTSEGDPSQEEGSGTGGGEPDVSAPKEERDCFGISCIYVIIVVVVTTTVVLAVMAACALCLALFTRKKKKRKKRNRVDVLNDEDILDPQLTSTKHSYAVEHFRDKQFDD